MQRSEQIASVVALRQLGYEPEVNPRGALVTGTFVDTPAIGKLELGDVIVAVDGRPVRTPEQLRAAIATRDPGDSVTLTVRRGGKTIDVKLTTIASPTDPERPIVGIQVDQEADVELPFEVDIDLGSVGVDPIDNDATADHASANGGQNAPYLYQSTGGHHSGSVMGRLNTRDGAYHVDFYASPDCDSSGHGEGRYYLGRSDVAISGALPGGYAAIGNDGIGYVLMRA